MRKKCFQVEPGFFLALSVSVPSSRKPGKEGEQVEWRPEDVSDAVLLAVLQRAYDMFHLFQGELSALEAARGHAGVREATDHFFTRYLATLRLEGAGHIAIAGSN